MTAMMPKGQDNYREFRNSLGRFTAGNPGAGRRNVKRAGMQALMDSLDEHIHAMVSNGELDRVVEAIKAKAKEKNGGSGLVEFLKELQSLGILSMLMNQADRDTGSDDSSAEGKPTGITICMYKEEPPAQPDDGLRSP